jgi:hypothetical protein
LSSKAIAERRHVSYRTIDTQKKLISKKVAATERLEVGRGKEYHDNGAVLRWFLKERFEPTI